MPWPTSEIFQLDHRFTRALGPNVDRIRSLFYRLSLPPAGMIPKKKRHRVKKGTLPRSGKLAYVGCKSCRTGILKGVFMGQRFVSSCFLTAALLFGGAGSEAQNLEWVHGFGNASIQPWVLEVPEGSSDVYLAGSFQGTQDFNHSLGTATLQSSGFSDAFVAKYDSSGQFLWAGAIGGVSEWERVGDIEIDSLGNVYVWGNFRGTADFDPGPGVFNMTAGSFEDAFLLKLNTS
ncbi:MAG: hypothetical protein AAGF23_22845, partial [Acidobacteriota bacterium]